MEIWSLTWYRPFTEVPTGLQRPKPPSEVGRLTHLKKLSLYHLFRHIVITLFIILLINHKLYLSCYVFYVCILSPPRFFHQKLANEGNGVTK